MLDDPEGSPLLREPKFPPNRIRELREARGMPQAELARAAGISEAQMSKFETRQQQPNQGHIYKIANALGCRPWELFDGWPEYASQSVHHGPNEAGMSGAFNFLLRPAKPDAEGRYRLAEIHDDGSKIVTILFFRPRPDDPPAPAATTKSGKSDS